MLPDQENGLAELTEEEELTRRLHAPFTSDGEVLREPAGALQALRCRPVLVAATAIAAVVSVAAFLRPSPQHRGGVVYGDANALSQLTSADSGGEPQPFIYDPANKKALFPRVTPQLDAARNVDAELQPGTVFEVTHVVQNPTTHMLFAAMVDNKGYVPLWIPTIGEMARRITEDQASANAAPPDKKDEALAVQVEDVPNVTTKGVAEVCVDNPQDWQDIDQSTCKDYAQYCHKDGTMNSKWDPEWGTFKDNIGALGTSANQACCACGGGIKTKLGGKTKPSTTVTTTTTTTTGTSTTSTTSTTSNTTTQTTSATTVPPPPTISTNSSNSSTSSSAATSSTTLSTTPSTPTTLSTTLSTTSSSSTTLSTTTASTPTTAAETCNGCEMATCISCEGSPTMSKTECTGYQGTWQRTSDDCS